MEPTQKYTVVSLFSGGMGLDLGLAATGRFRLLACVEKIPAFCDTMRVNAAAGRLGEKKVRIYQGDITEMDPGEIMQDLGLKTGELDIIVGGPPCQSFSTTGKRGTVQDPRGTLLWQYLRFIEAFQPKMFLMENVRGLMSAALHHRSIKERPDKGGSPLLPDEQPGSVLRLFVGSLGGHYRLDCFEVNAVNYGAPQLRERALFVGNRFGRVIDFPAPTHGDADGPQSTLFGNNRHPFRTLGEALAGLKETAPVIMDFSPRKKKYLGMVPPGSNWRSLPPDIAKESMGKAFSAKGGRSGWWRRLSLDLPCPTVVTMPNHASTALCHPTETRALTLRECARIQEFPDDWEFCGKTQEQYAQVGNAVPVRLGEVCGNVLAAELDKISTSSYEVHPQGNSPCRVVYVQSHVRTRQWYKAGRTFVWQDGDPNGTAKYGAPKTQRKVRVI